CAKFNWGYYSHFDLW
nr:immunoglobulin heavy chain junction region [Macaca mulatta]